MQSFEGQSGQFKPYSPFNRKPVELRKIVVGAFILLHIKPHFNEFTLQTLVQTKPTTLALCKLMSVKKEDSVCLTKAMVSCAIK